MLWKPVWGGEKTGETSNWARRQQNKAFPEKFGRVKCRLKLNHANHYGWRIGNTGVRQQR